MILLKNVEGGRQCYDREHLYSGKKPEEHPTLASTLPGRLCGTAGHTGRPSAKVGTGRFVYARALGPDRRPAVHPFPYPSAAGSSAIPLSGAFDSLLLQLVLLTLQDRTAYIFSYGARAYGNAAGFFPFDASGEEIKAA